MHTEVPTRRSRWPQERRRVQSVHVSWFEIRRQKAEGRSECREPSASGLPIGLDEHLRVGLIDGAVAAIARLEVDDGFEEMTAAEIGPENFGDVDLGVCDLPE